MEKAIQNKQTELIYDNDINLVIVYFKQIKVLLQKSYLFHLFMTGQYANVFVYVV